MTNPTNHLINESDIGSGEETPGERETREHIERVGSPHPDHADPPKKDRVDKAQDDTETAPPTKR